MYHSILNKPITLLLHVLATAQSCSFITSVHISGDRVPCHACYCTMMSWPTTMTTVELWSGPLTKLSIHVRT